MKKFTRRKENFACANCGKFVFGDGYTNHCPECLWSKHVDNSPGDRACQCQGLMKPIGLERKGSDFIIIHQCVRCGHTKRNRTGKEDNFGKLIEISNLKT